MLWLRRVSFLASPSSLSDGSGLSASESVEEQSRSFVGQSLSRKVLIDPRVLLSWDGVGEPHLVLLKVGLHRAIVLTLSSSLWESQEPQQDQPHPQHVKSSHLPGAEQVSGPEASNVGRARKTVGRRSRGHCGDPYL